jgi:hypothetical protein
MSEEGRCQRPLDAPRVVHGTEGDASRQGGVAGAHVREAGAVADHRRGAALKRFSDEVVTVEAASAHGDEAGPRGHLGGVRRQVGAAAQGGSVQAQPGTGVLETPVHGCGSTASARIASSANTRPRTS